MGGGTVAGIMDLAGEYAGQACTALLTGDTNLTHQARAALESAVAKLVRERDEAVGRLERIEAAAQAYIDYQDAPLEDFWSRTLPKGPRILDALRAALAPAPDAGTTDEETG